MNKQPNARFRERDALIDLVELKPGQRVIDIQAAGGYLSDAIHERLNGEVDTWCIEPCAALRARIDSRHHVVDNEIDDLIDVPTKHFHHALGLAGLHHSPNHQRTVDECFRVLRLGGTFAVCDVILDSPVAHWLNDFVDANTPSGHKGKFLRDGELSGYMQKAGFVEIWEERQDVPWTFPNKDALLGFFKGLFGITCPIETVDKALHELLNVRYGDTVEVDWTLIYARGVKPSA